MVHKTAEARCGHWWREGPRRCHLHHRWHHASRGRDRRRRQRVCPRPAVRRLVRRGRDAAPGVPRQRDSVKESGDRGNRPPVRRPVRRRGVGIRQHRRSPTCRSPSTARSTEAPTRDHLHRRPARRGGTTPTPPATAACHRHNLSRAPTPACVIVPWTREEVAGHSPPPSPSVGDEAGDGRVGTLRRGAGPVVLPAAPGSPAPAQASRSRSERQRCSNSVSSDSAASMSRRRCSRSARRSSIWPSTYSSWLRRPRGTS